MCDRFGILHLRFDKHYWHAPKRILSVETAARNRFDGSLVNTPM